MLDQVSLSSQLQAPAIYSKVGLEISTVSHGDQGKLTGACGRDCLDSAYYSEICAIDFIVTQGNHSTSQLPPARSCLGTVGEEQHVRTSSASISVPSNFSTANKGLQQHA